jgi:hypothetical protein
VSLSLLSRQRTQPAGNWIPLQWCHVVIVDDILSAAENSFVFNTFSGQKVVNFKAQKSLQVESSKASCHALQPIINCNLDDCNQQNQTHDASLSDQTHRATCKHCFCRRSMLYKQSD